MLPPIDRASLALINRHVHSIIGHALNLSPQSRYYFLSRLERDGVWLWHFLCQSCRKFHLPRQCKEWTVQEGRRACIAGGDERVLQFVESQNLPSQVYFDILAVIARSYKFGSGLYGLHHLASSDKASHQGAKMSIKTTAKIAQGYFLLKTEMMLVPAASRKNALEGMEMLRDLLRRNHRLLNICQHAQWARIWPFIFKPNGTWRLPQDQKLQGGEMGFHGLDQKDLHKCLWAHERTCWIRCSASSRLECAFERLWSCELCSTDYSITTLHVGNAYLGSNILVLTSWKNLGKGQDVYDTQWTEHMRTSDDAPKTARSTHLWTIAPVFEQGEVGKTWFSYYPDPRNVPEDFFPRP